MITRRTTEEYEAAVAAISAIPKFSGGRNKSGNENLNEVLAILGHPEQSGKVIHIAGTNGKGSVTALLRAVLNAMGYTVGCFTSPHLERINERISISAPAEAGEESANLMGSVSYRTPDRLAVITDISDDDFTEMYLAVQEASEKHMAEGGLPLSYFEYLFAMAAVYFKREAPDYIIYETGLGGRLDATNLTHPLVSVITSIGFDHTKYLGNTIEEIAAEKAGIIKPGVPVVYNTGSATADLVIEKTAEALDAPCFNVATVDVIREYTSNEKSVDFSLHSRYYSYDKLRLACGGALYQTDNAATAVSALTFLFPEQGAVTEQILRKGFAGFFWPGRMEWLSTHLLIDGAHNEDAILRFAESAGKLFGTRPIRLMFAVAGDKDYERMMEILSEELLIDELYVTSLDSDRGISAEYIGVLFQTLIKKKHPDRKLKVVADDDIDRVFSQAYQDALRTDTTLVVAGSLYLIGHIRALVHGGDRL